nr:hypothetical protein [uncultured Allomuricauda sp.]
MEIEVYQQKRESTNILVTFDVDDQLFNTLNISKSELSLGLYIYIEEITSGIARAIYSGDEPEYGIQTPYSFGEILIKCKKLVESRIKVNEYELHLDGTKTLIDTYNFTPQ